MDSSCLCGAIKVTVNDKEFATKPSTLLCHCTNCKTTSGSIASAVCMIEESKVEITNKEHLTLFEDKTTDSGTPLLRRFCKTCGSPIYTSSSAMPGSIFLRLGAFTQMPPLYAEVYACNRQPFEKGFEGVPAFAKMPGGPMV